jgi:hypothetical protein
MFFSRYFVFSCQYHSNKFPIPIFVLKIILKDESCETLKESTSPDFGLAMDRKSLSLNLQTVNVKKVP